jgi:hemerythrin
MIEWKPEYGTGIPEIDADHQHLFRGLNNLEQAMHRHDERRVIEALLVFLETYAKHHFAREEACMHRLHCPNAAANKTAHAHFLSIFASSKRRLMLGEPSAPIAVQLHQDMCNWITDHILTVDMSLKECVHPADTRKH